jgi:hypothetical protein
MDADQDCPLGSDGSDEEALWDVVEDSLSSERASISGTAIVGER